MVLPQGVSPIGGAGFWGMGVADGEIEGVVLGGSGVVLVSAKTILIAKKKTIKVKKKNK